MDTIPWLVIDYELKRKSGEVVPVRRGVSGKYSGGRVSEREGKVLAPVEVHVWSEGREYRFKSIHSADYGGFRFNGNIVERIRKNGFYQTKNGRIFWFDQCPSFVEQWRETGVMDLPFRPKRYWSEGSGAMACISYMPSFGIRRHESMTQAMTAVSGSYYGGLGTKMTNGKGYHIFRKTCACIWFASIETPKEIIDFMIKNPNVGNELKR